MLRSAKLLLMGTALGITSLTSPANAQTDWTTFAGNFQRNGYNANEITLSPTTVPNLIIHWSHGIASGTVGQALLMHQVTTAKGIFDVVYVFAQNGQVSARNALTDALVWQVQLNEPVTTSCNTKSQAKLKARITPTIDPVSQRMFVVDGGGLLHALSIVDGTESTGFPIQVIDIVNSGLNTAAFGSITMVNQTLYITTADACGGSETSTQYQGGVTSFDLGLLQVTGRWFPSAPFPGGGIWGMGGVSAELDGSSLYAATGNTATHQNKNSGFDEKVVQLDPNLNVLASNGPVINGVSDLDFGATPLLFQPPGCNPLTAVMNKNGMVYLYDRTNINGGPLQGVQVSISTGNGDFIGVPVYDPVSNNIFLGNTNTSPDGTYQPGLIAFNMTGCQMTLAWQFPAGIGNINVDDPVIPAVVANGVVYWADGIAGDLYALTTSGQLLYSHSFGSGHAILAAPTVINGQVFVMAGTTFYAFGL